MTDVEQIFQAIHGLPVRERLRLVERVVRDLADAPLGDDPEPPEAADSLIGLFADDPGGVDEMMGTVTEMRRRSRLRPVEDADAKGSS